MTNRQRVLKIVEDLGATIEEQPGFDDTSEILLMAPAGHYWLGLGLHESVIVYGPGEKPQAWARALEEMEMGIKPCCDEQGVARCCAAENGKCDW